MPKVSTDDITKGIVNRCYIKLCSVYKKRVLFDPEFSVFKAKFEICIKSQVKFFLKPEKKTDKYYYLFIY